MLQELTCFIDSNGLFRPGEKLLLAVSGGIDSVVMEELFFRSGYTYGIVHCNFKLRGKESDADEEFVRARAVDHGKPFYCRSFDTRKIASDRKISIQMAARELRYSWFNELLDLEGYDFVATAHHQDDQVETFLINLARGTGIAGLHGIPVKSGRTIRPMLFTSRKGITSFAESEGILYRHDRSNDSVKYQRNRIRLRVIPQLEKINPSFREEILKTISRIRDVESVYREALARRLSGLLQLDAGRIRVPITELERLEPQKTLMFELLSPYGFNESAIKGIIQSMVEGTGRQFFSSTHRLVIDRRFLVIEPMEKLTDREMFITLEERSGETRHPFHLSWLMEDWRGESIPADKHIVCLDAAMVSFPLTIRHWREGDYFYPLGMNGRKKLSDYFIDIKFALHEKEDAWLLCSGNDILWIIGHRIDHRYRVTENTARILKLIAHSFDDTII